MQYGLEWEERRLLMVGVWGEAERRGGMLPCTFEVPYLISLNNWTPFSLSPLVPFLMESHHHLWWWRVEVHLSKYGIR